MTNDDTWISTKVTADQRAKLQQYGPNFETPWHSLHFMPDVQAQVLQGWQGDGIDADTVVAGEMMMIQRYIRENGLPWHCARMFFNLGMSAYYAMQREVPSVLPLLGSRPPKLAGDGDVSAAMHPNEPC